MEYCGGIASCLFRLFTNKLTANTLQSRDIKGVFAGYLCPLDKVKEPMMIQNFKILTVTHKQANLSAIEDFVLKAANDIVLQERLAHLKAQFDIEELFYLPTCNRVMYLFSMSRPLDTQFAAHFFQYINPELSITTLERIEHLALLLEGEAAINHLFEVSASIDSMVVGERQILGQLREAYDRCLAWGLTGDNIRLAIQNAVISAKEVYAQTRIGEKPVSIVSLAIQQMMRSNLSRDARILLVGAGQTNALVAKFLKKHNFSRITVFNRSLEKAEQLAATLEGRALPLSALATYQEGFDCMIVCTGATEAIVTPELYAHLLQGDRDKKVVIDLSIPNNVHRATTGAFSMQYIEIDDLRQLAKENLAFREQEIAKAQKLLAAYIKNFPDELRQRHVELALRAIPEAVRAVKEKAINEVFKKEVAGLDAPTRELLERMMTYMEKKCVGIPMKVAKASMTGAPVKQTQPKKESAVLA